MDDATLLWATCGLITLLALGGLIVFGRVRGGRRAVLDEKQAYLAGVHYLLLDDTDAAIEALTRVVEVNSETIETYFALGALFRRKGELERATRIHQNILLRPGIGPRTRAEAQRELGLDYRAGGLLEEAARAFEEAERVAPKGWSHLPEVLAGLRDVRASQGRLADAVEAQRRRMRCIDDDERSVLAYLLVQHGERLIEDGERDEGRRLLKEALKADSECVAAHLALGRLAAREGQRKAALKHCDRAIDALPETVMVMYPVLADLHFEQGAFEALGTYLQEVVRRHPDAPHAHLALARHLRSRRLTERAVEELRAALDLDPGFHAARQELGRILLDEDKGRELKEQFEALLEAPKAPSSYVCARCGQREAELTFRCPRCQAFEPLRWQVAGSTT